MRALIFALAVAAGLLAFGFVIFAVGATRDPIGTSDTADGIVVLTGGESRILAGARLLSEGRAKRMLISGVNRKVTREDIRRISKLERDVIACCVDLGYEALDTVGNAGEARNWARGHGYSSLLVVTSSYHMPRSLAELSLAMPDVELIPAAVLPPSFPESGWWLHARTARLLISEYLKYIPAIARLGTQRLLAWSEPGAVETAAARRTDG